MLLRKGGQKFITPIDFWDDSDSISAAAASSVAKCRSAGGSSKQRPLVSSVNRF